MRYGGIVSVTEISSWLNALYLLHSQANKMRGLPLPVVPCWAQQGARLFCAPLPKLWSRQYPPRSPSIEPRFVTDGRPTSRLTLKKGEGKKEGVKEERGEKPDLFFTKQGLGRTSYKDAC